MNTEDDHADRWAALMSKLDRDEQDLVSAALSDGHANGLRLACVLSCVAGLVLGAGFMHLLG